MECDECEFTRPYQVNVAILEGRHLALTNANSHVIVSIGRRKKKIKAKTNKTDSPYYNDFCSFYFKLPLKVLLDEILTVKVYQVTFFMKKLVGSFNVELATIWSQPNHQFYHKWAVLTDPKNPSSGVRGFLKCDVVILTKGVVTKPPDTFIKDNLEQNLLVPYGGIKDRHRFRLAISVFRADSFSAPFFDTRLPKFVQPYIRITYGGNVRSTSIAKKKKSLVWNEEVMFLDLFPPLSQSILIELCDRRCSIGNTSIDIRDLYENDKDGFLPTFGPNFVYLYYPLEKVKRHKNCCEINDSFTYMGRLLMAIKIEILDYPYDVPVQKITGRILPKSIPPLVENLYFEYNRFILFATIFDVLFFDTSLLGRNINFRLTIGPKGRKGKLITKKKSKHDKATKPQTMEKKQKQAHKVKFKKKKRKMKSNLGKKLKAKKKKRKMSAKKKKKTGKKKKKKEKDLCKEKKKKGKNSPQPLKAKLRGVPEAQHINVYATCNTTPNQKCKVKSDYSFITYPGKFPCVHVYGEWPDTLVKMYRSNVIKNAIQSCSQEITRLKQEIERENPSIQKLQAFLQHLSKSCEVILLYTGKTKRTDTNLTRERRRYFHKEISEIIRQIKSSCNQTLSVDDALEKISTYLAILTKFARDPENSFPDTEIWMAQNGRITSQHRLRTQDLAFSSDYYERGTMAGKQQTLLIKGNKNRLEAKVDIFIWFGLADDFVECLKSLPPGFKHEHTSCPSSLDIRVPTEIIYEETHYFQCRIHIFQAKILFGFDDTGLVDPFVRIIILGQHKMSQVIKQTLSPVWDETLIIPTISLYGPSSYIKNNPATIMVEVFDQEKFYKSELVGRTLVKPIVKLKEEKYEPPQFPPKLKWEDIMNKSLIVGQVLMVTELLELSDNLKDLYSCYSKKKFGPLKIPDNIRPRNIEYKLEVIFWGLRELKKRSKVKNKVFLIMDCGGHIIKSPVLKNVRHRLNFPYILQTMNLCLPEESEYAPPLTLKLYHIGGLSSKKYYVATCIVPSIKYFYVTLGKRGVAKAKKAKKKKEVHIKMPHEMDSKCVKKKPKPKVEEECDKKPLLYWFKTTVSDKVNDKFFQGVEYFQKKVKKKIIRPGLQLDPLKDTLNWWIRYHASVHGPENYPGVIPFKVYREELEAQPEFQGLMDFLSTHNLVTGHQLKKQTKLMAKVKIILKLYKSPPADVEDLLFNTHRNDPIKVVVRVYIVCAKNLCPHDVYGKSDPYLHLQLGEHTINDRKHYAPKQVNPVFGKCFEIKAIFPRDYLLRIKVIDYDKTAKDDLIGETIIDVENRYYSRYHASCGVSTVYEKKGFYAWRDIFLPTDILNNLCQESNLDPPIFNKDHVIVGGKTFPTPRVKQDRYKEEEQALVVINRWNEMPSYGFSLVPEHIETRSLYHPKVPGIEQGKLEMWVDVFPADYRFMPPKVDITTEPPVAMELRAIVWNVDDVVLDDKSFFFQERMSDIYVRGWILSLEEEMQRTDIHYRSLNGEGNFNWRFIFHFNYIPSERMMLVKKKLDAFDQNPEERRSQCKLEIQIWDNDSFGDDYLGTCILELCSMPRGAKLSSRCTLKMLAPSAAKINLFKIRRTRGWWPFRRLKERQTIGNEFELTGKIDLELEILTQVEALQYPAGKGRDEPDPLPPPSRPVTSFNWMVNPLKTFRYIILRKIAKCLIITAIVFIVFFFIVTAILAFPNFLVMKYLNV